MNVELLAGRELKIDSIEADDGEDEDPSAGTQAPQDEADAAKE